MTNLTVRHRIALAGTAVLVCFVLPAAAQECSNADFKGRYAAQTSNAIVGGTQGNWAAGTLCADGSGMITEWKDTFVFGLINSEGGEEKVVRERDHVGTALGPVTYEVGPDCRITIRYTSGVRPPADREIELKGGLALGGKEVLATVVLPMTGKGGLVMKSITPPGEPWTGARFRRQNCWTASDE